MSRRSKTFFSKQYAKACNGNARIEKKEVPLELQRAEKNFGDSLASDDEEIGDLKWFFKKGALGGARWSRLHRGLAPGAKEQPVEQLLSSQRKSTVRDSINVDQSTAYLAGQTVLGIADAASQTMHQQQRLKQLQQRSVSPSELQQAAPPEQLHASTFPPLNTRRYGPCKKANQSHFQFFAKLNPSENVASRRANEQRVGLGKIVPLDTPRVLLAGRSQRTSISNLPSKAEAGKSLPSSSQEKQGDDEPEKPPRSANGSEQARGKTSQRRSSIIKFQRAAVAAAAGKAIGDIIPELSSVKKSACEALRMAIYGKTGQELAKTDKEAAEIFKSCRGSSWEVVRLYQTWKEMDEDESGDLSSREVMNFFASRGLAVGLTRSLQGIFGSSNGGGKQVCLEDLMRVMWPRTQEEDIEWMKGVIFDFRSAGHKCESLKELTAELIEELRDTFTTVDLDNSGAVTMNELILSGALSQSKALEAMRMCGRTEDDEIDFQEFCDIMCPAGYFVPKNVGNKA
jgi:Ca2+-binding EF-hand superfamily protein